MLSVLRIQNLVVIDQAEVVFRQGLNIISGETGAGKSIVLEAVALLLGGRASADLVRSGEDEAVVEGLFDLKSLPLVERKLEQHGFLLVPDQRELLVKRVISKVGRHRIYLNGELATLAILQSVCDGLVEVCSQHEHQSLLRHKVQLGLVDKAAHHETLHNEFQSVFAHFQDLERELASVTRTESERQKHLDFLSFQISELDQAKLEPGEDTRLVEERKLLQSAEQRLSVVQAALSIIRGTEGDGMIAHARDLAAKLRVLTGLDDQLRSCLDQAGEAGALLEMIERSLETYSNRIEMDGDRLTEVLDRLSMLADFKRKYGTTVEVMIQTLERLKSEQLALKELDSRRMDLEATLKDLRAELAAVGQKLHMSRKVSAAKLSRQVTQELRVVGMPSALFDIKIVELPELSQWSLDSGPTRVEFEVRTNAGDVARPVAKVASGGELSRIMLGLRAVSASDGGTAVYVFDEVDAGIGGQTAFHVGQRLKDVALGGQVLCITHLPQIAAFADHHVSVQKFETRGKTRVDILQLDEETRTNEIARMLGGPSLTTASLRNAQELLALSRESRRFSRARP